MSPLATVRAELKAAEEKFNLLTEEERQNDELLCCSVARLRWTELSMEYNRNQQLKYVYSQLGDKAANPKFRQMKIRSLFGAWKREVLRQKWMDVKRVLDGNDFNKRIEKKHERFSEQRALIAGRAIAQLDFVKNPPVADLIQIDDPLESLHCFQIPSECTEFADHMHDYLESSAVKTITEIPSEDETHELIDESIRQRLKERGLALQDEIIEERKRKEEEIIQEQARRKREEEEKAKPKSNLTIPIIIILIIVAVIAVFIYVKSKQATARKLAEEACKNAAKNAKKGWFGK
jgi:hypothetical protein